MRGGFYPRIALTGMKKNRRLYLPYLFTCIGMIMMYYIILFLAKNPIIASIRGGDSVQQMLGLGSYVMAFFAVIFLFYTHSFLIRRRKKEFGLYNILGMGKRNIGMVMFWETVFVALGAVGIGLFFGIVCSKLGELILVNVLKGDVKYSFLIDFAAMKQTMILFGMIFLLIFINTMWQVGRTNAIALLHSENVGEKPPKANWFLGLIGIALLGGAYYLAVTIENPLDAMMWFFVAVIMVIIATYLIFIAGSVLICKLLQKNKKYYYQKKHFVSVSSMAYRMKRNGAGLASICILATMVLVMLAGSACLYMGSEDSLQTRYPKGIVTTVRQYDLGKMNDEEADKRRQTVNEIVAVHGGALIQPIEYRYATITGVINGDELEVDYRMYESSATVFKNLYQIYFVPVTDYNKMTGSQETLADGEAMMYTYRCKYEDDILNVHNGGSFRIIKKIPEFRINSNMAMDILPSIVIVVPDFEYSLQKIAALKTENGEQMLIPYWYYGFDLNADVDEQVEITQEIYAALKAGIDADAICYCESREANRYDFYATYGGIFFLGILLSIVFLFATVLIMYYKQISEGYEDQARFAIMQKVGMTKENIRKSINSQMLTVFFMPLVMAVVHLAFAFPMIRKLLMLFNLMNVRLLVLTTLVIVLIFAVFYAVVYKITSNAYISIVSDAKNEKM